MTGVRMEERIERVLPYSRGLVLHPPSSPGRKDKVRPQEGLPSERGGWASLLRRPWLDSKVGDLGGAELFLMGKLA